MEVMLLRKSPMILIKNFILFQSLFSFFIAVLTVTLARSQISLFGSDWGSITLVIASGVLALIVIFMRWYTETFHLMGDRIVHKNGLLGRKESVIRKSRDYKYEISQSALGRILKYQNISVKFLENTIVFKSIGEESLNILIENLDKIETDPEDNKITDLSLTQLLKIEEGSQLEFKSSLRWDFNDNRVNKKLEEAVIKNIIAFINSEGGVLLIGIDDQKKILGLKRDFDSLRKRNPDGFENHLNQLIKKYIGVEFLTLIKITFENIEEKQTCRINVESSPRPVFTKFEEQEYFFIRTGNSVSSLTLSEAYKYFESRFKSGK